MLKRLRIKFVCINMTIVTILLCLVLSLVLHFTQENLETQSIRMMEAIAAEPFQPGLPGRKPEDIFLPYFTVHLDNQGNLVTLSGTYFDLSDQDLVAQLVAEALAGGQTGVLEDYHLRYLRVTTPMGEQLVFADISSEIKTMESLLRTCLLMGVLGFLAFLVISLFLARWAVRPVEKAWDQQRHHRGRERSGDHHHHGAAVRPRLPGEPPDPLCSQHPHHRPADAWAGGEPAGPGPGRQRRGQNGLL